MVPTKGRAEEEWAVVSPPLDHVQRRHLGEGVEVAVVVQERAVGADAHHRDQAVRGPPDRQAAAAGGAVDLRGRSEVVGTLDLQDVEREQLPLDGVQVPVVPEAAEDLG